MVVRVRAGKTIAGVHRGDAAREDAASAFQREHPADHVGQRSACREDRPRFESRQLFTATEPRASRLLDGGISAMAKKVAGALRSAPHEGAASSEHKTA